MVTELPDPCFIAVLGDLHGNWRWGVRCIGEAARALGDLGESRKIMIQVGDFGFKMPNGISHEADAVLPMNILDVTLHQFGMELWWLDGNHEDWPGIRTLPEDGYLPGMSRIRYLRRGTRWTWRDRTWLACGGAASVDRLLRKDGVSWWADEEITEQQACVISEEGHADVMLSHDCPAGWLPPLPPPADAWLPELPRARAHSERLRDIVEAVQPSHLFHGHYHVSREDYFAVPWNPGLCKVTGLTADGYTLNMRIIDIEKMFSQ